MIRETTNGFKAAALKKIKALESEIADMHHEKRGKGDIEKLKGKLEEFSEKVKKLPGVPRRDNLMSLEKHFYELLKV